MEPMDLKQPLNAVPVVAEPSDADAAQEKKALCVSLASLILSIPALVGA